MDHVTSIYVTSLYAGLLSSRRGIIWSCTCLFARGIFSSMAYGNLIITVSWWCYLPSPTWPDGWYQRLCPVHRDVTSPTHIATILTMSTGNTHQQYKTIIYMIVLSVQRRNYLFELYHGHWAIIHMTLYYKTDNIRDTILHHHRSSCFFR